MEDSKTKELEKPNAAESEAVVATESGAAENSDTAQAVSNEDGAFGALEAALDDLDDLDFDLEDLEDKIAPLAL